MALIKCPECGKEISDKATNCPNCGCPVIKSEPTPEIRPVQTVPKRKSNTAKGCLITILILFGLFIVIMLVSVYFITKSPDFKPKIKTMSGEYIEMTDEEAQAIDSVLISCGIDKVKNIQHDELLDGAHLEGETGYRMDIGGVDNIILYLNPDKTVYSLRYADYDLYINGATAATIQDYSVDLEEATNWQIQCQDKIKTLLKAPSTADFPGINDWGFRQEKNIMTVQGYVDSQNGFGAQIRSQFQFIIDTDTNTIQSLIFDGEEMIK